MTVTARTALKLLHRERRQHSQVWMTVTTMTTVMGNQSQTTISCHRPWLPQAVTPTSLMRLVMAMVAEQPRQTMLPCLTHGQHANPRQLRRRNHLRPTMESRRKVMQAVARRTTAPRKPAAATCLLTYVLRRLPAPMFVHVVSKHHFLTLYATRSRKPCTKTVTPSSWIPLMMSLTFSCSKSTLQ